MAEQQTLIRYIRTIATSEGIQKFTDDIKAAAVAQGGLAEASNVLAFKIKDVTAKQLDATRGFESTKRGLDGAYRAMMNYRVAVERASLALSQGKTTAEEYSNVVDMAAKKYEYSIAVEAQRQASMDKTIAAMRAQQEAEAERADAAVVSIQRMQAAEAEHANSIKASYNPLFAAQLRYNEAIEAAQDHYTAGKISIEDYAAGIRTAEQALRQFYATQAKNEANNSATFAKSTFNIGVSASDSGAPTGADSSAFAVGGSADQTRASYDAVFKAQQAYRAELKRSAADLATGAISQDVYTAAVEKTKAAFVATMEALNRMSSIRRGEIAGAAAQAEGEKALALAAKESAAAQRAAAEQSAGRAKYDEVYAAQERYRAGLAELSSYLERGWINEEVYAKALAQTKSAFVATMESLNRMSSARRAEIEALQAQKEADEQLLVTTKEVESILSSVAAAQRESAQAAREAAAAIDKEVRSIEQVAATRAKFIEGAAAADEYAKFIGDAMAAVMAGTISETEYAAAIDRRIAAMNKDTTAEDAKKDADSLTRLRSEFIPLERAAATYQERLAQLSKLKGKISDDQYSEALARESAAYRRAVKSIEESGNGASKNFRLTGYELTNLAYQFNDVATMAMAGSSGFQIFATQGGQVYQILAGSRGGLVAGVSGLASQLLKLISPLTVAGAAVAAMGVAAYVSYDRVATSWKKLDTSLQGSGKSVGATAGDLFDLAEAGAKAAKVSTSSAAEMIAAYASTGKVGKEKFTDLVSITNRYAKLTGTDTADAAQKLATSLEEPTKGAADLDKQLNFLTQSEVDLIRQFDTAGKKSEAQRVIMNALNRELPDANRNIGYMAAAWEKVANWADKATVATGKALFGANAGTLEKQIADAEAKLSQLQRVAANPASYISQKDIDASVEKQRKYLESLKAQQSTAADIAKTAQTNTANKEATSVAESLDPRISQLQELQSRLSKVRAALYNPANAETGDLYFQAADDLKQQIAAIVGADGKLATASDQMRQRAELEIKVTQAKTQAQKDTAAAALAAYDAQRSGAAAGVVEATREIAVARSAAEMEAQLSEAQRQRFQSKKDSLAQGDIEIAQIGKTAIQQKLANDNLQDWISLNNERIQKGTGFDEKQYDILVQQNEKLAAQAELKARLNILDDQKFQRDQLGRGTTDQTIASTQRSAGLPVDMNSVDAQAIRLTETMRSLKDQSSTALDSFVSDLLDGKSAAESLSSVLKNLAKSVMSSASKDLVSSLFSSGGGVSSLFGSIFGSGGAAFSGANLTGGLAASMFHTGGTIGTDTGLSKTVDPIMFRAAPRYHGGTDGVGGVQGLTAGEIPIIAKVGEEVGWPSQLAQKYGGRSGNNVQFGDTTITVQGNADSKAIAALEKKLADYKKQIPGIAVNAVINAKQNNPRVR